ncbi:MAG: hypothetical protein LBQ68_08760 [Clostridiales bacterium]|nr:hypothetical protein [Clostridiales bacterium]
MGAKKKAKSGVFGFSLLILFCYNFLNNQVSINHQFANTIYMLIRFLIFGAAGWIIEIIWTGFVSLIKKDFRLTATTSIWMFFIYGLVVFMGPLCDILNALPVIARGGIYTLCIFTIEYITGVCLKKIKICPWDYSDCKFAVRGVIRLDFAPAWFTVGLIFERMHMIMRGI